MDTKTVIQQHKMICRLITEKKIKQSLDILQDMIDHASTGILRDEYDIIVMTYRNMLKYTIEGVEDPERNKIYLKLMQSILALGDRVRQDILSRNSGWHTYWVKQQTEKEQKLSGKSIVETVDDLMFKSELDEWLKLSNEVLPNPESEIVRTHKKLISNIFNHFWLTDYYGEAESSLINILRSSGKFKWHEAGIFISAITLSSLRTWDIKKIFHLIDIYEDGQDQTRERALSGLILNLYYYNDRIKLFPEITNKIKELSLNNKYREHCRIIVLQTIKSRETEKLGKRLSDEILPQVAKLRPRIEERLGLDNILPEDILEGKNPDWAEMFSESDEIFKTMEELTNLQMEGSDVYMSAFKNLKHFDFFKDLQNWFMPFYTENEIVDSIFKDEILGPNTDELAQALYKTPFICNSDKYSLILNLKQLPSAQKSMMLKVFRMELEGLEQMNEGEVGIDQYKSFRICSTQYLQDLYRFFKLSPYKNEFEDLFSGRLDIYNSEFFRLSCNASEAESGLADYFFSKNYYDDALELFLKHSGERPDDAQLYEKIGYCFQQTGKYNEALKYYKRAELIDRKVWTIKKIGLCLRRLGKDEDAIEYYLQASDLEPENIHTTVMIAHCYLDLLDYETSLKYYFKVEYKDPGNIKILRPIAWCFFAQGRFDESEKYYDRLSESKLNAHDFINMGHLALCKGDKKSAIEYYRKSIITKEITKESFMTIFWEDEEFLLLHGVNPDDLPILLDYLLFIVP
jgi:tetratricopeptide (TPR) repeat protein